MIITIDGPSGSGKSTLAKKLAGKLGYFYVNSGFLYRALAYILVHQYGYDEQKLHNLVLDDIVEVFDDAHFLYTYENGHVAVLFQGQDITSHLKDVDISKYASIVAMHVYTRQATVPFQRRFAATHDIVCEGRDCGTEVFPQADLKFYVTADVQVRAQRLQHDLAKKGKNISLQKALDKIATRDHRDQTRAIAPLRKPDNAVVIDTSYSTIEESLQKILDVVS